MFSREMAIRMLLIGALLVIARLAVDFTAAAAYVFPEFDVGQKDIAFVIFILAVPCVLILALVRLFQKRLVEAGGLLIICCLPFSFDETLNRQLWKFRIHKSDYQSIMQSDPGPPPKYRVFNWGNRNTQLMGGGVLFEAIVYDESNDIALWSPEWGGRRSNPSPEDRWITMPSAYPSCKRRTEPFGDHFYYVSEEC